MFNYLTGKLWLWNLLTGNCYVAGIPAPVLDNVCIQSTWSDDRREMECLSNAFIERDGVMLSCADVYCGEICKIK